MLGLIAVIVFLQTRDGSDRPENRGPAEEEAVLGAAIQLHAPFTAAPPASPADEGTAAAVAEQDSSEPSPPDADDEGDGEPAEPEPGDSPGPREDRPSGGGDDPVDPMDLIDDVTDELPGGGR